MRTQALRDKIRALGPWYQNIQLAPDVWTKDLTGDGDIFADVDIPGPLWQLIARDLGDISGMSVLDVGCNAGYMSFECKKLGARSVLGIDTDLGAHTSFIEQARFCREVLGLDVEFRKQSLFELVPMSRFDLVLFCGVLYHLENWADALDRLVDLVVLDSGRVVVETAIESRTSTFYEGKGYNGDTSTFFVPSFDVLLAVLRERGFRMDVMRNLGTRALAFVRLPSTV